jgi:Beta-propeller repeat
MAQGVTSSVAVPRPVFVENCGQFQEAVRYRTVFPSPAASVTDDGLVLTQVAPSHSASLVRGHNVRLRFESTDRTAPLAQLVPGTPSSTRASYFRGNDSTKWISAAPCMHSVIFEGVASDVSVEVHTRNGAIEYDVLAQPGASLQDLVVIVEGADAIELQADGSLLILTPLGQVKQQAPVVWQTDASSARTPLTCRVERLGPNRFGFRVPDWDSRSELTIDPSFVYSTFVEGSQGDLGNAIAVDTTGAVYVAGDSSSFDFPVTPGAFDTVKSPPLLEQDGVVFKVAPGGGSLEYATFLGGFDPGPESPSSIQIDIEGNAYVAGSTTNPDFPTTAGAYATTPHGGADCYVTKLDPSGANLVFSTYFGGTGHDNAYDIALTTAMAVVMTGPSQSPDLPTSRNAAFPTKPSPSPLGNSGFVARFSADGSSLECCTYFGGATSEYPYGIGVDAQHNIYIGGQTQSGETFPATLGAYQTSPGGSADAFIAKFSADGALTWATYLGGSGSEYCFDLEVDASGHAFITGETSGNFPTTPGAFDTSFGGWTDTYVSRLSPDGTTLEYSGYLGGNSADEPAALALGQDGSCYVFGRLISTSTSFVTPDALDPTMSPVGYPLHLARLSADGSQLLYGTFLGGENDKPEFARAIAVSPTGLVAVTGYTQDKSYPTTPGAFDATMNGATGLYVSLLDLSPWSGLGHGLAGTGGVVPVLAGSGTLQPGSSGSLTVTDAAPTAACTLVVGLDDLLAPFKGGTLVPAPLVLLPLATDGGGVVALPWLSWPAGIPAGTRIYLQAWAQDAGASHGWSASNGLLAWTPVVEN